MRLGKESRGGRRGENKRKKMKREEERGRGYQKEAASSMLKRTPPIGAPKAAATPATEN